MDDLLLTEIETITQKTIQPGVVDNYFKAGPIIRMLMRRFNRRWAGPQIQENYLFRSMKGGAYKKGDNFDLDKQQTFSGIQFDVRYYDVNVTEYLEDLEVEMVGPQAVFNRLRTDMANAAFTMSAILEIAIFRHGQNRNGEDRTAEINGLEEGATNGTDATFSGATFPVYGGQTRAANINAALNSPTGLIPSNIGPGAVTFHNLVHSHLASSIGAERPMWGVTTKRAFGYIAETFHPSQRIDTVDPELNWPGFRFQNSTIVTSDYAPGADGVVDADLGDYSAANETFWWLNPGPQGDGAYLRLYIAASPKFAFGFTGFKGARGDNQLSGQVLFAGNFVMRANRLQRGLFGING